MSKMHIPKIIIVWGNGFMQCWKLIQKNMVLLWFIDNFICLFVWVILFELNLKQYGRLFKNYINNFVLIWGLPLLILELQKYICIFVELNLNYYLRRQNLLNDHWRGAFWVERNLFLKIKQSNIYTKKYLKYISTWLYLLT